MSDKNLMQTPLPPTARQIKTALAARRWLKPGYRTHNVRPRSKEASQGNLDGFFAGAARIMVSDHPGLEMMFFSDDATAQIYFYFGQDSFESTSVYLWSQMARQCRGIWDIGADTGLYALLAAKVAHEASVVAFEPIPHFNERVTENAALNGFANLIVRREAIGDFNADTKIMMGKSGLKSLGRPGDVGQNPSLAAMQVSVRSIDDLYGDPTLPAQIDLMKINAEGDEYNVLDGARDRIARNRPTVFCDVQNDETIVRIAAFAGGLFYDLFYVNEESRSLTHLISDGELTIPDDPARERGFGKVVLSPDVTTTARLVSLAQRFAQKPRIAREVHHDKTPPRRHKD